jgi:DNA-binding IclR family transcriptional regulator
MPRPTRHNAAVTSSGAPPRGRTAIVRNESLRRGLLVLRTLSRAAEPLTAAEVARRTGLASATAQRLLATLSDEAMAVRDDDGGWRPGPGVLDLAGVGGELAALVARAGDVLRALANETGETAVLTRVSLPDVTEVLVQEDSDHLLGTTPWVGRLFDLRRSVAGWVVAAQLGDAEVAALGGDDPDVRDRWIADVALARERGYALDVDRLEPGLTSLAVLLETSAGALAVGAAGPSTRLTPARARAIVPRLRDAATTLASFTE